ncbi:hypothetical protein IPA_05095 [Ignicoccus pacificus DSM 13166]|uniref:Prefoldin subunit alpha n=1 Tax=Ignicoccus pacificus DSM 13166 TaxID=940294 RepID=A0A977PLG2_9CREN|nr:hypothetical protein IPA_05095 [Ignicoccus pacificus DSM 13166]
MSNKEISQEALQLLAQYEQLKGLVTALANELEKQKLTLEDINVTLKELEKLEGKKEGLVPLGVVLSKAEISDEVLVPIGANYYVSMKAKDAIEKVKELKKIYEENVKNTEKNLNELLAALSAIEGKLVDLQRGAQSAGKAEEGAKESSK